MGVIRAICIINCFSLDFIEDDLHAPADLQSLTSKSDGALVMTLILVTMLLVTLCGLVYYRVVHNTTHHIMREDSSMEPIIQIISSPSTRPTNIR